MATELSYHLVSNTHTSLNGGSKEPGFIDSSIDLITKGVPATLIAAGNELLNIPMTIGNMITGTDDYKLTANRTAIADIDSDLARYYDDHQMGIDTAGFIVSSFVPGMVGTKVLRAGQVVMKTAVGAGKFGKFTGSALGLAEPMRETFVARALTELASTGNVFSLSNANMLKAFAAGAGQEFLEGAAWTAAVNATMHNSPILDQRDTSDLMWDVLTGGVLGGAIGGTVKGAQSIFKVKAGLGAAEKEVLPVTIAGLGGVPAESLSASDKILFKLQQIDSIPAQDPTHPLSTRIGNTAQRTQDTLYREIRGHFGELSQGDEVLAGMMFEAAKRTDFDGNVKNFIESNTISRVTKTTRIEHEANKVFKQAQESGLVSLSDDSLSAAEKELARYKTSYVNLRTLENLADAPLVLNLADHATPVVKSNSVKVGGTIYKQADNVDISSLDHLKAEARYLWAESSKALDPDKVHVIGARDIPMMKKAIQSNAVNVNIGEKSLSSMDELVTLTKMTQAEVASDLIRKGVSKSEVAKIVDASEDVLFGGMENPKLWNLRASQAEVAALNGVSGNVHLQPTFAKIVTKSARLTNVDGNLLEGMTIVAQKEKLYQERARQTAARGLGEILPSAAGTRGQAFGVSTGPGFTTSEAGGYGTQSSFWSYVGQRANNLIRQAKEKTAEIFNPTLVKLASSTDDAIEFSVLNEKLRNLPSGYVLSDDGASLVFGRAPVEEAFNSSEEFQAAYKSYAKALAENEAAKIPNEIPIKSSLVQKLIADHIQENGKRRSFLQQVHVNNGYQDRFQNDVFYPIPRNIKDTPYFSFVIDESVSGRGHSKMIYAKDATTLEHMRNQILSDPNLQNRGLKVLNKIESEEYYKSIGQYEFERTLSDNYINNALARSGKSSSFLPVTDPSKIAADFLAWHQARDASLVRTLIEHNYAHEFGSMRATAETSLQAAKSKFGYISPLAYAENTVNNPATNLIKMALDISKIDEYPVWSSLNKFLDGSFSKLTDKISSVFKNATSMEHLDEINVALKKAGYQDVLVDSALYEAMNGTVPRGTLSTIINRANSILATFALRADPFNALNNAVGSSVLLGSEAKALIKAIEESSEAGAGELAKLLKVKVPGTGELSLAPGKLVAARIAKFHNDKAGREWFRQHGFISSITDQYDQTLDYIGISIAKGDHGALQKAMVKAKSLGDAAEKYTGNKLAEEFNRYVAAGVMKDITDLAVKHGVLDEGAALPYINTFVNRTQGNYLASQRPVIFQGPLGQAMGLFQTYQFNMLQQIFRHIGEGKWKNVATMMGLQGGIYGMNGLPAFNAINTHIIGDAGGNPEHKNLYDAIMSGGGKEAGEWILYGGLSNGLSLFHPDLKLNLYSRGDINPRNVTILPTDPSKIPIYQATERLFTNTKDGISQIAMGADVWGTILRGIEQNGISRPLAGMAQVMEGFGRTDHMVVSTNRNGNMLMAHDLWSLNSLARVFGAKPLDEAIVNDQMFRIKSYQNEDLTKRKLLGGAVKTSILNGAAPDQNQIDRFAYEYAKAGGKQDEFASWMAHQYTNASVSQAEQLRSKLESPYSQSLQLIMRGGE